MIALLLQKYAVGNMTIIEDRLLSNMLESHHYYVFRMDKLSI